MLNYTLWLIFWIILAGVASYTLLYLVFVLSIKSYKSLKQRISKKNDHKG